MVQSRCNACQNIEISIKAVKISLSKQMSRIDVSEALNQISLFSAENPADIYLFQAAIEAQLVKSVQSYLLPWLLTFSRFHAFFWYFHCWVWTRNFWLKSCRLSEKLRATRMQSIWNQTTTSTKLLKICLSILGRKEKCNNWSWEISNQGEFYGMIVWCLLLTILHCFKYIRSCGHLPRNFPELLQQFEHGLYRVC